MENLGEILREARHQKRVSIQDASRATKIKPEILEQLEAGEYDQLASPTYTKGFLKLYAGYLGLDSAAVVDAYVRSQGGLRRQGLQLETEVSARQRQPAELELNLRSVVLVVAALTAVAGVIYLGHKLVNRPTAARSATPAAAVSEPVKPAAPVVAAGQAATLPVVDFEAYYQPKSRSELELLDASATR